MSSYLFSKFNDLSLTHFVALKICTYLPSFGACGIYNADIVIPYLCATGSNGIRRYYTVFSIIVPRYVIIGNNRDTVILVNLEPLFGKKKLYTGEPGGYEYLRPFKYIFDLSDNQIVLKNNATA